MYGKRTSRVIAVACVAVFLATMAVPANAVIIENQPALWWDFNSYSGDGANVYDVVQSVPLFSNNGTVGVIERSTGDYAADFSASDAFFNNQSTGLGFILGAYAIEFDVWIPAETPSAGQYIVATGHNQQAVIYGYNGTEVEFYNAPRTDGGPTNLNDGQWHTVVMASYGNSNLTEGYVDKLVYSLDGGALQSMSRQGGVDTSRLDLSKFGVGAPSDVTNDFFSGAVDNFAVYDLSVSVTDWEGDVEGQLDAAVTAIATNQQRELGGVTPNVDPPAITSYGWSVLKDNPKFYYSFNEAESTQFAMDSVRGQLDDSLTSFGGTRDAGSTENLGQTAVFDGSSFFKGAAMQEGQTSGAWAIEFWVKDDTTEPGVGNAYIANVIGTSGDTSDSNSPGVIYGFEDGKFELYADSDGRAGNDGPSVTDNDWHHVVFAFYGDGTVGAADRLEVSVDGVVNSIARGSFSKQIDNRESLILGAALNTGVDAFTGRIDEFAIYDLSGLSEAEVAAKVTKLAGHYALANNSAETNLAFVDGDQISYTYGSAAPAAGHPDSSGKEMVDGDFGSTLASLPPVWSGFQDADADDGTVQAEMTFDLGDTVSLDSIWINYGAGGLYGVNAPDSVEISLSTDGVTFDTAMVFDDFNNASLDSDVNGNPDYIYARRLIAELGGEEASHVRLSFFSDAEWVFLNEIQFVTDGAVTPPVAGDANKDGKVDGSDVTILAGNWQVGVDGVVEATWEMGDFNGDGKVDGSDVTILAGNWQYGVDTDAASVPEPSTVMLLFAAATALLGFTWRRKA